jgi:hypothetical protein
MEKLYKEKYDSIVRFLYHEYLASISSFEGLASLAEKNNDPLLQFYVAELKKLRRRVKDIESQFLILEDFRHPKEALPGEENFF